jgi:putative transposase
MEKQNQDYRSTEHSKYLCNYHLVWIPKYRKGILIDGVAEKLKDIIYSIAKDHKLEIFALEVMPDHIHLFLSAPPRYSPSYLANLFKGVSARKLGLEYPYLRRKEGMWTRAYFVSTHGHVSSETIRKYVEEQTGK